MVAAMKLFEGRAATTNLVRSYDAAGITIGAERHELPLLVSATDVESLEGRSLDTLSDRDVARIVELKPDLVLAGGGGEVARPPSALRRTLEERRIAIEAMQLGAACRTFNVLVQEDRAVVALLLP